MSSKIRFLSLYVIVVCIFACKEKGQQFGARSEDAFQTFTALQDSMLSLSPSALDLIDKQMATATDSLTWYDYYLLYGRHYLLTEKPDTALYYASRTLHYVNTLTATPRTNGLKAMALSTKAAYLHLLHHSNDSTIALYHEAYNLMMHSDLQATLPDLSANLGDAYMSISDLPNASKWYRRALFLTDSLKLPERQTLSLYMGLGRIYTVLRDFDNARIYYTMTDSRIEELKPNMQSYFLNNYGNYFYFKKDYPQALATFRRMERLLRQHDNEDHFDWQLCHINMADVFLNLGQTDSARIYLIEPEAYFIKNNVDVGVYYAQTIRIGIALREKRYDEVERIISDKQAPTVEDIDMRRIRNEYMNQYYAAIGDYRRAYHQLQDNITQTDSAEYQRYNMQSSDVMIRLTEDTLRLHHQLAMQQRDTKHAQSLSRQYLFIGLLIIVILAIMLYVNHQRKRYLQTRLDMLTQRLLNARQRVSPHFIFNVLNSHITKLNPDEGDQLRQLAKLIRINLDLTRKTFVTLGEELEFIQQYINIGKQLDNMQFDFDIEAPEGDILSTLRLPSMMVQILVENAILHGLKNKEGEKKLLVKIEDLGTACRVSVIDNGLGFDISKRPNERTRTGLRIIRTTINALNMENKKQVINFNIHNDHGCHAILTIAKDIKYPIA